MGYIGPAPKFGQHQKQVITGDSSTVTFTLDYYVTSENNIMVIYNGVIQEPGAGKAYTTSGNSITFSVAPTTGSTCWIIFLGQLYDVGTVADNAIVAAKIAAGAVTKAKLASDAVITMGTEQATTTGTAFDFTGIPAGVKKIIVMFNEVSLSGTDDFLVQIGDAGGIETSGYLATSSIGTALSNDTTGYVIRGAVATAIHSGHMILTRFNDSHLWIASHAMKRDAAAQGVVGGGSKTLSAELTQVRVTRDGANTFDAGSVNIMYEGK